MLFKWIKSNMGAITLLEARVKKVEEFETRIKELEDKINELERERGCNDFGGTSN